MIIMNISKSNPNKKQFLKPLITLKNIKNKDLKILSNKDKTF